MACIAEDSPCFIAGDDLYYDVQYTESDGTAKDLTGATAAMELRETVTDVSAAYTMTGGIVDATNGAMRFTRTDTETAAMLPRAQTEKSWVFSVKITFSDGTKKTILSGSLTLHQKATA